MFVSWQDLNKHFDNTSSEYKGLFFDNRIAKDDLLKYFPILKNNNDTYDDINTISYTYEGTQYIDISEILIII